MAGDATTRNKLDPIETKALRPQKRTPSSPHAWGFLKWLLPQFLGFWLGEGVSGRCVAARPTF